MADIDVKLRCPERLVFNETLQRCDWPETTSCKSEKILVDEEEKPGFCTDKVKINEKRFFSISSSLSSPMEIMLMNNSVIDIIFVKMVKMLFLHVKII